MITTVTVPKKDLIKKPEETELDRADRLVLSKLRSLDRKKKRTEEEEKERKELTEKVGSKYMLRSGDLAKHFSDEDLKSLVSRVHDEFASAYGIDTPIKRILIHRIASAWNMSQSYERLFAMLKYNKSETGSFSSPISHERTGLMKEVRRGIESSNDQLLRLTQALQNLVQPPIQVKATNAFFAHNQQVNQSIAPKDLDKNAEPTNHKS